MEKMLLLLLQWCVAVGAHAQCNTLSIPDTFSGTQCTVSLRNLFTQVITGGANGHFWEPTLLLRDGDIVRMDVYDKLHESPAIRRQGVRLPAVIDGGPHPLILPHTPGYPVEKQDDLSVQNQNLRGAATYANREATAGRK